MESLAPAELTPREKAKYLAFIARQRAGSGHPRVDSNVRAIELCLAITKVARESQEPVIFILQEFCENLKQKAPEPSPHVPEDNYETRSIPKRATAKEPKPLLGDEEMLLIAGEMKNVAGRVHATLKRDKLELSMTAELQDTNLSSTTQQRTSANSIASSKKIGLFLAIWMVASSAIIFVVLAFIIVVIT